MAFSPKTKKYIRSGTIFVTQVCAETLLNTLIKQYTPIPRSKLGRGVNFIGRHTLVQLVDAPIEKEIGNVVDNVLQAADAIEGEIKRNS